MNEKKYLTVKEVADKFSISRQSVYNKLDNEFKPYLTIINDKKMLKIGILKLLDKKFMSSDLTENMSAYLTESLQILREQNSQLQSIIATLQEQLHTKDIQIEQLQLEISTEHHHSREQSDKLAQLAENAQQLQKGQMVMNIDNSKMITDKVTELKAEESNHWWSNLFRKDKNNI